MKRFSFLLLWFVPGVLLLCGCGGPDQPVVTYTENVLAPPGSGGASAPASPAAEAPLAWTLPDGWTALGASNMRLQTFRIEGTDPAVEVTITAFPGRVGGIRANLERWLRQLELPTDPATLDQLEDDLPSIEVAGGWPARWVDFRSVAASADQPEALLGAMVFLDGQTVYVKCTAAIPVLDDQLAAVRALVQSLHSAGGAP